MPGQALAQDDFAPLIHSHHVKHALCNVDPENAHRWFHWTRLLWLYGFTDRELIDAHRSRSAQGRVRINTNPVMSCTMLMHSIILIAVALRIISFACHVS